MWNKNNDEEPSFQIFAFMTWDKWFFTHSFEKAYICLKVLLYEGLIDILRIVYSARGPMSWNDQHHLVVSNPFFFKIIIIANIVFFSFHFCIFLLVLFKLIRSFAQISDFDVKLSRDFEFFMLWSLVRYLRPHNKTTSSVPGYIYHGQLYLFDHQTSVWEILLYKSVWTCIIDRCIPMRFDF